MDDLGQLPHRRRALGASRIAVVLALSIGLIALPSCAPESPEPGPSSTAVSSVAVPPSAPAVPLSRTTLDRTGAIMAKLIDRTGPKDPRYYEGKQFQDGTPECFRCTLGPAVLAATYGVHEPDKKSVTVAIATFDQAIKQHQQADGTITPEAPGEGGPGIQTTLFANALAYTYLTLEPQLDESHRTAWANSLARSADYLIRQNTIDYYVNGNINLSMSMNMDLTYRVTGLDRFRVAAERSLSFTLNPPQDRWSGFGLTYVKEPQRSDGADGAGYLAESGGGAPGFDPAYSLYQLDIASLWFLITGEPAAQRLANLLFNQVFPLVRTSDWTIDVSGGTRRDATNTRYGFTVSALPVLALKGGRTDLQPLVGAQVATALDEYTGATGYAHPGQSNNFGAQLAPTVAVIAQTPGW